MKHAPNWIFYTPFSYTYYSRIKRPAAFCSFLAVRVVPVGLACWLLHDEPKPSMLIWMLLGWLAYYGWYEIGYLQNDLVTVTKEENPTQRVRDEHIGFFHSCYTSLVAARFLYTAFFLALFSQPQSTHVTTFIAVLAATYVAFLLHNHLRSRANIFTYFALSSLKMLAVPALLLPSTAMTANLGFFILLFPLVRTWEHAGKPKYGFTRIGVAARNPDAFRVAYYALLVLGSIVLQCSAIWSLLFSYMLAIRCVAYLLARKGARLHNAI